MIVTGTFSPLINPAMANEVCDRLADAITHWHEKHELHDVRSLRPWLVRLAAAMLVPGVRTDTLGVDALRAIAVDVLVDPDARDRARMGIEPWVEPGMADIVVEALARHLEVAAEVLAVVECCHSELALIEAGETAYRKPNPRHGLTSKAAKIYVAVVEDILAGDIEAGEVVLHDALRARFPKHARAVTEAVRALAVDGWLLGGGKPRVAGAWPRGRLDRAGQTVEQIRDGVRAGQLADGPQVLGKLARLAPDEILRRTVLSMLEEEGLLDGTHEHPRGLVEHVAELVRRQDLLLAVLVDEIEHRFLSEGRIVFFRYEDGRLELNRGIGLDGLAWLVDCQGYSYALRILTAAGLLAKSKDIEEVSPGAHRVMRRTRMNQVGG